MIFFMPYLKIIFLQFLGRLKLNTRVYIYLGGLNANFDKSTNSDSVQLLKFEQ